MSDEADISQERLEREEEIRRRYVQAPVMEVGHTGYCLDCGEPLQATARWCDADCRDMWEKRKRL